MIKVLYSISVVLLLVTAFLIKKKNTRINFYTSFFTEFILFTCYNIVICLALKALNINSNLSVLLIPNYIISMLLVYKIIKDKRIQKFYISKKDTIAIIIIIFIGLLVSYKCFGFPFGIPYVEEDASNHYRMITDFYETEKVKLGNIPGAYINIRDII